MIEYSTWKNYLLTSSPLYTLVSKANLQSGIYSILNRNYTGFDGYNIAKFIDYQILANKVEY